MLGLWIHSMNFFRIGKKFQTEKITVLRTKIMQNIGNEPMIIRNNTLYNTKSMEKYIHLKERCIVGEPGRLIQKKRDMDGGGLYMNENYVSVFLFYILT